MKVTTAVELGSLEQLNNLKFNGPLIPQDSLSYVQDLLPVIHSKQKPTNQPIFSKLSKQRSKQVQRVTY